MPKIDQLTVSSALAMNDAEHTLLGEAIQPQAQLRPDLSGISALDNPHDAFVARAVLMEAAEKTLDIQYYIWRKDITGTLLLQAVYKAAERGVRIRLLLDDNGIHNLDAELNALAQHPNIEVRLFNPFVVRNAKWLGFITDFSRANRRMHNKALIADNQIAIMGGRNIGDEYFGATDGLLFADLDVVAVGKVVPELSADFDRYWSSKPVYPIEDVLASSQDDLATRSIDTTPAESSPAASRYITAIRESELINKLVNRQIKFDWSVTTMLSDDPVKGLGKAKSNSLMSYQLEQILDDPQRQVSLISPYFVPTKAIAQSFIDLAATGVKVQILTNSLDATDVVAVHAGYAKRRYDLVAGGVQLFEMRRQTPTRDKAHKAGVFGSSSTSLHAKTFALDSERIFVGSFNFDPRSTYLNTELGFLIDSAELASTIEQSFEYDIPHSAYEVKIDANGKLYWVELQIDQQQRIHAHEPEASMWRRAQSWFLSLLPIERFL